MSLEGEGDVAAVGRAGAVSGLSPTQFGVSAAFGGWDGSPRCRRGCRVTGEKGGKVFLDGDVLPPVVTGRRQLIPGVGDEIERASSVRPPGESRRWGQLGTRSG